MDALGVPQNFDDYIFPSLNHIRSLTHNLSLRILYTRVQFHFPHIPKILAGYGSGSGMQVYLNKNKIDQLKGRCGEWLVGQRPVLGYGFIVSFGRDSLPHHLFDPLYFTQSCSIVLLQPVLAVKVFVCSSRNVYRCINTAISSLLARNILYIYIVYIYIRADSGPRALFIYPMLSGLSGKLVPFHASLIEQQHHSVVVAYRQFLVVR